MSVPVTTVVLMLFFIWCYSTIADSLKEFNVDKTIESIFGNMTNTTHPFIALARNGTTKFAAGATVVGTTVLKFVPVSLFFYLNN